MRAVGRDLAMHGAGPSWIALIAVVMAASPAAADHECSKIKDGATAVTYTADLAGLAAEPGCAIRVPAKLLCVDTTKSNVRPAPPGVGPMIQDAGPFLCYAVK